LEPVDLRAIAIDEIVVFRPCEIVVYPDEDTKPRKGEGTRTFIPLAFYLVVQ
jgi:hypothetical protein